MITFYDAKQELAEYVRTGLCPTHPDVARDINAACDRLLRAQDSLYSIDTLRIWTQNNSISLPRGYVSARMVRIDYIPRSAQSVAFEFLNYGPGNAYSDAVALVDEGVGHPCFFTIPQDKAYGLFAASSEQNDAVYSMQFRALKLDGSAVMTSGSPDLTLPINYWTGGVEGSLSYQPSNQFSTTVSKITQVILPDGLSGYVSFYAVDPDDGKMWFLSRYHPDEVRPGYRKYRLPAWTKGETNGVRGNEVSDGTCIECLCKKEHINMTRDNDLMTVQNMEAVKFMVMAINHETEDINKALAYRQMALANIQTQEINQTKGTSFQLNFSGPMPSSGVNMI